MKNQLHMACVLVAAALLSVAPYAYAVDVYDPGQNAETTLSDLLDRGYIGGAKDEDPLAKGVAELLNEAIKADSPTRYTNGVSAIFNILASARQRWGEVDPDSSEKKLLGALDRAWRQFAGIEQAGAQSQPGAWKIDINQLVLRIAPDQELDFKATYLTDACAAGPSAACRAAYSNAVVAARYTELTHRAVDYLVRDKAILATKKAADLRVRQWEQYFAKGIPQWPWELALVNGPIYGSKIRDERGLAPPPDWQMIVLHPDIAFEYMDDAEDGQQFRPALTIEVIGANLWSWDKKGKQRGPWGLGFPVGAGVLASYADRAGTDDWGWGGVIHLNHKYSFGLTTRSGDTAIFVSANVSSLFEDVMEKKSKFLGDN